MLSTTIEIKFYKILQKYCLVHRAPGMAFFFTCLLFGMCATTIVNGSDQSFGRFVAQCRQIGRIILAQGSYLVRWHQCEHILNVCAMIGPKLFPECVIVCIHLLQKSNIETELFDVVENDGQEK